MNWRTIVLGIIFLCNMSCEDEKPISLKGPNLLVRLKFDGGGERLDNIGNNAIIPPGNAAVTPLVKGVALHYIELLSTANTPHGYGNIIYQGAETDLGGSNAIDFSKCNLEEMDGDVYLSIPIDEITPGSYRYPRVMLAYQNVEVPIIFNGAMLQARFAGFLGYNTFISDFRIQDELITVNDDKLQGYWAMEVNYLGFSTAFTGQVPAYVISSPNPLYATSPIPLSSCFLTAELSSPLVITGNETDDITLELTFSTNQSFEWKEINLDGKFDPNLGELPMDVAFRGLAARYY